jgi:cytochrome P450
MNEAGEPGRPHLDTETLAREGQLALFAGADTTDSTLSNAFVYLITHPRVLARLRAELDATADDDADDTLREAPYLQAVINEVLRLQPAVPSGVQRLPPAQGGAVAVAG